MRQKNLFYDPSKLFEELCMVETLERAFRDVRRNKGSPGIDGVTVESFEAQTEKELQCLKSELESWTYKSQPVRRVEIPKPGPGQGIRLLGIPCVRDRVVQMALKKLLEPIFEPLFSNHSYGFRPNRSQKDAVEAARLIVASGKEYVVDIDLSKFFDKVNHDRLISRMGNYVPDKRILRLVGTILRSGVMDHGLVQPTTEGTTQGSPLSPLLSNVVLDELDKELEKRGLEFCRYADDCNIFVGTLKAAKTIMKSITEYIENRLKLKVNQEKSQVSASKGVKFLGMTIVKNTVAISAAAIRRAMEKVKELTPRGTSKTIKETIESINKWYVGWSNYFNMTYYPAQMKGIESHIRRRLRARIVDQKKTRRSLFDELLRRGVNSKLSSKVLTRHGRWALSHSLCLERAYSNKWFQETGLKTGLEPKLSHWYPLNRWIKLT